MRTFVVVVALGLVACSSSSSSGGDGSGDDGGAGSGNDGGGGSSTDGGSKVDAGGGTFDGGTGSGGSLSCNEASSSLCVTYTPPSSSGCAPGDDVVPACSTTDIQATCAYSAGGDDQLLYWYKSGGHTNASLKSACDSLSGTFTAY